jgi:hypothetical protein
MANMEAAREITTSSQPPQIAETGQPGLASVRRLSGQQWQRLSNGEAEPAVCRCAIATLKRRLGIWISRSAPLRYVAFLNEAKDLLFLRQVGGGYIFTHRLLRDYFASLSSNAGKNS